MKINIYFQIYYYLNFIKLYYMKKKILILVISIKNNF